MQINMMSHTADYRDGYGNMYITIIRKLTERGVCVTPIALDARKWPGWMQYMAGIDFSRLTIAMTPGYNIRGIPGVQWALSMYEATRIPEDWVENFNRNTRRVIVPSDWCREVFQNSGVVVPVDVVLGGTDPEAFPVIEPPSVSRPYTFMALGDRGGRKGWDFVWQAFFQEFKGVDDVRLIIKSRKYSLDNLMGASMIDSRVSIWRDDTPTLFDAFIHADCFVYPARSDGWGMPPREAAMMGIPVIATRYSGLTHGIDEWATRIVENYTERTSTIPGGGDWAASDVNEIASHMRWCYENRQQARDKGRLAAAWLRENQTYKQTIDGLIELLEMWA